MDEKKILVVDDDVVIRDILEGAFSRDGYLVRSAASGEEALGILSHESIPVMFIDLGLESMSGFELCERIRKDTPNTIIYALTGYAKLFGSDEICDAGFDDCFAKPSSIKTLYQAVNEAFKKIDQMAKTPNPAENVIQRILIIDDDDLFRGMLRRTLEIEGFEIFEAVTGEEGIGRFIETSIDLIITDIIMPKKDGIETIVEIKSASPDSRIIAMSGGGYYGTDIYFDIARKFGVPTLQKPFKRRELLKMINDFSGNACPK